MVPATRPAALPADRRGGTGQIARVHGTPHMMHEKLRTGQRTGCTRPSLLPPGSRYKVACGGHPPDTRAWTHLQPRPHRKPDAKTNGNRHPADM